MTQSANAPTPVQANTASLTAPLVEIFSAIQGEGLNVGTRQIFIRFGGCDLRCWFCDSAHTWRATTHYRVEQSPGDRDFITQANPASVPELLQWIALQHQPGLHDSISLTGGEPLLHAQFLRRLLPQIRSQIQLPLYLETGGHRPGELAMVLNCLDTVGLDLKLPSVSGEEHWQAHQDCLRLCVEAALAVFAKVIVAAQTELADLDRVAQILAVINPGIPLILQPVTPLKPDHPLQPPTPAQILTWQAHLKQRLRQVRVIPQTHKFIHQL